MSTIKRINHIALVVDDIATALHFWRDTLQLDLAHVEDVPDQESIVAFLPVGDIEVELVKPTSEESGISRYLQSHGPGIHHICFEVDDIEGCLDLLRERGVTLINPEPIVGTAGKRIAFLHPKSTHGVLIELYEVTPQEPEIRLARARGLADRAMNQGQVVAAGVLGFLRALRPDGDSSRA